MFKTSSELVTIGSPPQVCYFLFLYFSKIQFQRKQSVQCPPCQNMTYSLLRPFRPILHVTPEFVGSLFFTMWLCLLCCRPEDSFRCSRNQLNRTQHKSSAKNTKILMLVSPRSEYDRGLLDNPQHWNE